MKTLSLTLALLSLMTTVPAKSFAYDLMIQAVASTQGSSPAEIPHMEPIARGRLLDKCANLSGYLDSNVTCVNDQNTVTGGVIEGTSTAVACMAKCVLN